MPKIVDENRKHPQYLFTSREEFADFFGSEISSVLPGISKELGLKENGISDRIFAIGAGEIKKEADDLWEECSRNRGKIQVAVLKQRSIRVARRISQDFMDIGHLEKESHPGMPESVRDEGSIAREQLLHRRLAFAGLATGAILTVHGVGAALTATDRDGQGHQRRNRERTALHTVEALGGAALSWASIVALSRGSVRTP